VPSTEFSDWIGRCETRRDHIDLARAQALQATLEGPEHGIQPGAELPPLWHWIYFWDVSPLSRLDVDGHAKRGNFLPPVALPRRMWAGGRLHFHAALPIAAEAERRSTILRIDGKTGKSGALVFVTVLHEILVDGALAISEEQDIVYRDNPIQGGVTPKPEARNESPADWSRPFVATPPLLLRYSALTMNAHRIHYDLPYATAAEHYADLVVHGPLAATLLVELATAHSPHAIAAFSFRGLAPILAGQSYMFNGAVTAGGTDLWVSDQAGRSCMTAQATWRVTAAAGGVSSVRPGQAAKRK
jgi:3-methylfumaryl-CoA hydratase